MRQLAHLVEGSKLMNRGFVRSLLIAGIVAGALMTASKAEAGCWRGHSPYVGWAGYSYSYYGGWGYGVCADLWVGRFWERRFRGSRFRGEYGELRIDAQHPTGIGGVNPPLLRRVPLGREGFIPSKGAAAKQLERQLPTTQSVAGHPRVAILRWVPASLTGPQMPLGHRHPPQPECFAKKS